MDPATLLNFSGMIFESFIIIAATILLLLILRKYFEKHHRLTFILFLIFLNYNVAIIFSWLSKILVVFQFSVIQDGSLIPWLINRIQDFRISEFFVVIAIFISYVLKINVFEKGYNTIQKYIVIIYGCFTGFFVLIIYEFDNTMLDIFAFLTVFIFMGMIYIPFFIRSIESYKSVDQPVFKNAFLSLAIMSLSFTLIFLNFALDRLLIFLGSLGFTVFYYLAWICAIVGILGAYFGYVRPKSRES